MAIHVGHRRRTSRCWCKVTFSGEGMDGGPGIHTTHNDEYTSTSGDLQTYWLGALGSISPGTGSILISHIKSFLASQPASALGYVLKAYTVAEWGVNATFSVPTNSPLVTWFDRQGFKVLDYSWKPPGTWASFYGGCLAGIEYVYRP